MKLSGRQRREIAILKYFAPEDAEVNQQDIKEYLDYSDKGIKSERWDRSLYFHNREPDGLDMLRIAKQRREFQTKLWIEDIHAGLVFVWELVEDLPTEVRHLMKKILPIQAWETWERKLGKEIS